jgi:hypothetical protein
MCGEVRKLRENMENILVPIQKSEEDNIITLPNGKRFPRKVYSKYTVEELKEIIACCNNYTHIIQTLRINNYYHKYLSKFIKDNNVDISHFKRDEKTKVPFKDRLTKDSRKLHSSDIKDYLVENNIVKYECAECQIGDTWRGKPLSLQLDHINGDHYDNRIENLRLMCPMCHSQTDTYTGRNLRRFEVKRCSSCEKVLKIDNSTLKCADCIAKDRTKCTVCNTNPRPGNWSKCAPCRKKELPKRMCKGCGKELKRLTNKLEYHKKCYKHSAMKKVE